jgi:GT2 family glycosyltransferase
LGVDEARGEIVAFTDDDCLPRPGWIRALVDAFQTNGSWLGVQGKTVAEPGPIGSHAIRVSRPNSLYQTCNMAYRRDALTAAGGFDPDFDGWFEDTALAARVLERGPIGFASEALVVHRAVPRRPMGRDEWRQLVRDERLLARRYPAFYRRTRGPAPLAAIIARWLLGSPVKTLIRELPRAGQNPAAFASLARSLLRERLALARVLLEDR